MCGMKWLCLLSASAVFAVSVAARANTVDISQKGRKFLPDAVTINVGDTLRIHNDDEFLHHVYVSSPNFKFESEEQPTGNIIEIKFTHAGDFDVLCRIHPKMKLAVHVQQ
jgi:plastocyanin